MKIELSYRQAILLRGILNTSSKSLMEIGARPHGGWKYYEWKAAELKRYAKIIDKKIKEYEGSRD